MRLFSFDSKFMQGLNFISNLVLLNVIWLITSFPIITLGASTTSLYYCVMKMQRKEDISIFRDFTSSFKENFKVATFAWVILVFVGFVLTVDMYFTAGIKLLWVQMLFAGILILVTFFFLCSMLFTFPIIARFHNNAKRALQFSIILPFRHARKSLFLILITAILIIGFLTSRVVLVYGVLFLVSFGVASLAYFYSRTFNKIFAHYINDNSSDLDSLQ